MAEYDDSGIGEDAGAEEAPGVDLDAVYQRAMRRFDECAAATRENREQSLAARRFITIPGAQWDDDWGEQFANSIKVEIDKVGRGVAKIERDYRSNRIVPDFRPDGRQANEETAQTLDGMHRADSYRFKSQQARDNAVFEAIAGGFGAYRATTEWEDEGDKDNDHLRINPAALIADADQAVYFDLAARLYDKTDARYAFIRVPMLPDAFADEFEGAASNFPEGVAWKQRDWFTPETVAVAEYFEREDVRDALYILTYPLSGETRRIWASDLGKGELEQLKTDGWQVKRQNRKRCRIHKYILSGAEVLEDCGLIAGTMIPIIPVYGKRYFVDGIERWQGYVQGKMDAQRIYNSNVSRLAEINSTSPREVPIFAAEQMPPHLSEAWARVNIDRLPYLLVEPLRNEITGEILSAGPIGKIDPVQLSPAQAALIQIANNDLLEEMQDGSEMVKANTSAEAMDIAATRVDEKSGIYLDNVRQSVQLEGEIYLSMAADVYTEKGREVETMSEDGDDGMAKLKESATDTGSDENRVLNDFSEARYKVVVSVTEATATRRDKTVKSMLRTAEVANAAGDTELAQAAILTAVLNQDGEGIDDFQAYARRKALSIGLVEPNEEEAKAAEEASQEAEPDPMANLANAQAADFAAGAQKKLAEVDLTKAKTLETLADARAKAAPPAPAETVPAVRPAA